MLPMSHPFLTRKKAAGIIQELKSDPPEAASPIACLYHHNHTNKVCHFHFANCTSSSVDPGMGCS